MFWDTKDPPSHNIEILLESPDTKVEVFLEEDNIIQECKTLKKNIVNYFTRPDVLRRMVELITTEPPEEIPISERFRHANVACEILTMGLPSLDEKLLSDADTLNMLYSYLENEPPLNPLLASFISKTFSMFFTKKTDQNWFLYQQTCLTLLEYLKTKSNFLDLICKHFTTPIVPDLIMEMMQNVEGSQLKRNIYEWLNEQRLVEKLIEIIGDPEQSEKHANVADFLCDLIQQGRTMRQDIDGFEPVFDGSDPILQTIESATTLLALFNVILQPNADESAIVSGIAVVLKIIKPAKLTDYRNIDRMTACLERENLIHNEFLTTVIRVIEPQLKHFNELLKKPPKKSDISTSAAKLSPPFGMTRLQVVRLFAQLLEANNAEISNAISETDFLDILLTLFKEFCWNNFLHTEVEKCLHSIFPYSFQTPCNTTKESEDKTKNDEFGVDPLLAMFPINVDIPWLNKIQKPTEASTPSAIQVHAIANCKIVSRLIECWKTNKEIESNGKGRRLGYMGHLIQIFNHITKCISESQHIGALIESNLNDDSERDLWHSIVNPKDGELNEILITQSKFLAGHEPGENNVSLEFFTDNNISDTFDGLCTLMDSSDPDVIFTLDYNTQHDDYEFDDDDVDDDYNVNNGGRGKDQRNDDVKNALNLFQFGSSNDDDGNEDDTAAPSIDGDRGLLLGDEHRPNPFSEDPWGKNNSLDYVLKLTFPNVKPDSSAEECTSFDMERFRSDMRAELSMSNTNIAAIPGSETVSLTNISSNDFDNNANFEKPLSCVDEFKNFPLPKIKSQFTTNFIDDYEDDEGMWTKPFGSSTSTGTVEQSDTQLVEPSNKTDDCTTKILINGPRIVEEGEPEPQESPLNLLSNSIEDNTLIDLKAEDTTSKEKKIELDKEINNFNIREAEEKNTSKHNPDTKNIEIDNTNTNQLTNAATSAKIISDGSTTAT